jgi:hypothetical protein
MSYYQIGYVIDCFFVLLGKQIEVSRINTRKILRRRGSFAPPRRDEPCVFVRVWSFEAYVAPGTNG